MRWRDMALERPGARWVARRGLELAGATSLAVAWPVLDAFGRSPETFVARRAAGWEIVGFAVLVFLGPPLLLLAFEVAARRVAGGRDAGLHHALIVMVAGGAIARLLRDAATIPGPAVAVVAMLGMAMTAVLRARWRPTRQLIQAMGITSVWYVIAFIVLSPAGALVHDPGGRTAIDEDMAAAVGSDLTPHAPPVVVVVFDALPTVALLDGQGAVDARVAPHLADLAGHATTYRNHTTVSGWTLESLGVIATGTLPSSPARDALDDVSARNMFTLLDGAYDMHVHEPVTRLCPVRMCALEEGGALPGLLDDAVHLWLRGEFEGVGQTIPGALDSARLLRAQRWADNLDVGTAGRSDLVFLHVLLPHDPFEFLPDGTRYRASQPVAGIEDDRWVDSLAADTARQRHLLQVGAADALLGRLLQRLRDADVYQDALVVVTADHGIAFTEGQPSRDATPEQYEQVLWTPLLVKYPGQTAAGTVDSPTRSTDIVPTIADVLGVDIPWPVDGVPVRAASAAQRSPVVQDWVGNHLGAAGSDGLVQVDGGEGFARVLDAEALPAPGPLAIWQQASDVPLVGRRVQDLGAATAPPRQAATAPELIVTGLDRFSAVDLDTPLPIEVSGEVSDAGGGTLALSLNGVVAAAVPTNESGRAPLRALLHPAAFVGGHNTLSAWMVDDTGRITRRVDVRPA